MAEVSTGIDLWWCIDHQSKMVTATHCEATLRNYFGRTVGEPPEFCRRQKATLHLEES